MMYHPISSSVGMVEIVISDHMSPHCDIEPEDSKPVFLRDTLAHDEFGSSSWRDMVQMNIHWNSEPFLWPWPQQGNQSFHKTIQLMMIRHQSKCRYKRISISEGILESYFDCMSFTVPLTLKAANQSFQKTIWLMMMHYHTKNSNANHWTGLSSEKKTWRELQTAKRMWEKKKNK